MASNIDRTTAVIDGIRGQVTSDAQKISIVNRFCEHVGLPVLQGVFHGITSLSDLTVDQKAQVFLSVELEMGKRVLASVARAKVMEQADIDAAAEADTETAQLD